MRIINIKTITAMKNKILLVVLCLGMASSFWGCSKKLSIENPNTETIDQFWTNATDANEGVVAAYAVFVKPGYNWWFPILYNLCSDEGWSESGFTALANTMQFIYPDYNFLAGSIRGQIDDVWGTAYTGIYRCNQIITYVPPIKMDTVLRNQYIGEAKFLRAYFYFNLINFFGNVPLVLEPNNSQLLKVNSTEQADWQQCLADLKDAETMLPLSYSAAGDIGRVTQGAAHALRAEIYLQLRDYASAQNELQWIVEGPGATLYSLMPDYMDNFTHLAENNKESIFEIQYSNVIPGGDTQGDNVTNESLGSARADFIGPQGVSGCFSDARARRWMINEFLAEKTADGRRDPRLAVTLLYDSTDERGPGFTNVYGQTWTAFYGAGSVFPNNPDYCWFHKYLNDYWRNDEDIFNSPINSRVFRLGDMLLLYAECLNAGGNTSQAYQYVDRVRQRSGLAPLSTVKPGLTQDQFFQQLKHERITEMCGEMTRWLDLKRWGDLDRQSGVDSIAARDPDFKNFVVGKNRVFPIPQKEIDLNPSIQQNPGW